MTTAYVSVGGGFAVPQTGTTVNLISPGVFSTVPSAAVRLNILPDYLLHNMLVMQADTGSIYQWIGANNGANVGINWVIWSSASAGTNLGIVVTVGTTAVAEVAGIPNGLPTLNGHALLDGESVLLTAQAVTPANNILWFAHAGAWTSQGLVITAGDFVSVSSGTLVGTFWTYGGSNVWDVNSTGGGVPATRAINGTSPVTVNGGASATLAADITLAILPATHVIAGSMSAADKTEIDALAAIPSFVTSIGTTAPLQKSGATGAVALTVDLATSTLPGTLTAVGFNKLAAMPSAIAVTPLFPFANIAAAEAYDYAGLADGTIVRIAGESDDFGLWSSAPFAVDHLWILGTGGAGTKRLIRGGLQFSPVSIMDFTATWAAGGAITVGTIPIPAACGALVRGLVTGRSTSPDYGNYDIEVSCVNTAGAVAIISTAIVSPMPNPAAAAWTYSFDVSGANLLLRFAGAGGNPIVINSMVAVKLQPA